MTKEAFEMPAIAHECDLCLDMETANRPYGYQGYRSSL